MGLGVGVGVGVLDMMVESRYVLRRQTSEGGEETFYDRGDGGGGGSGWGYGSNIRSYLILCRVLY